MLFPTAARIGPCSDLLRGQVAGRRRCGPGRCRPTRQAPAPVRAAEPGRRVHDLVAVPGRPRPGRAAPAVTPGRRPTAAAPATAARAAPVRARVRLLVRPRPARRLRVRLWAPRPLDAAALPAPGPGRQAPVPLRPAQRTDPPTDPAQLPRRPERPTGPVTDPPTGRGPLVRRPERPTGPAAGPTRRTARRRPVTAPPGPPVRGRAVPRRPGLLGRRRSGRVAGRGAQVPVPAAALGAGASSI